jgi:hypothetical protein
LHGEAGEHFADGADPLLAFQQLCSELHLDPKMFCCNRRKVNRIGLDACTSRAARGL